MLPRLCICATLMIAAIPAPAQDPVLARIDAAAAKFQGMSAKVDHITHTAVINDDSKESGTVKWRKVSANQLQGLLNFTQPDSRILLFKDRKLQIFTPASNSVQVYDLSRYSGQIEQFLMIGFGTPLAEIQRAYTIAVKDRAVLGGKTTTRIELVPRSPEGLKRVTKMELWIPDGAGYPIQEKVHEPSGDSEAWVYSDVVINPSPPLKDADLKLNLPKNVQFIYPQK
ncbi:MAG TPA: hypothetical protein VHD76_00340 [Bryobacteraceae bacterium]|nr:hypothetical protein [Bryobacteraceae bacterium]